MLLFRNVKICWPNGNTNQHTDNPPNAPTNGAACSKLQHQKVVGQARPFYIKLK